MRLFELFKDDRFSEGQKLDIALEMFAMNPEILKLLEVEEKMRLSSQLFMTSSD